jgi:hypothetical protein
MRKNREAAAAKAAAAATGGSGNASAVNSPARSGTAATNPATSTSGGLVGTMAGLKNELAAVAAGSSSNNAVSQVSADVEERLAITLHNITTTTLLLLKI